MVTLQIETDGSIVLHGIWNNNLKRKYSSLNFQPKNPVMMVIGTFSTFAGTKSGMSSSSHSSAIFLFTVHQVT